MSVKRYGILIANQNYPDDSGFTPLSCPLNDAKCLREVLVDPAHGDFTEVEIVADGTRRAILLRLEELLQKAQHEDLIFIYFSGHGKTNRKGSLFFAAKNSKKDRLMSTGINARDVSDLIRESNVSKKALVLDCCYAGAFPIGAKGAEDVAQDRVDEFSSGSGTYVLMATDDLSLAEEDPEQGLSVLTKHMVDGLKGKADANRDGIITFSELSRYVRKQVIDRHTQEPREAGLDIQGDVAVSKSGIEPDKELRARIRTVLFEWANNDSITHEVLTDALGILDKQIDLEGEADLARRAALDRIVSKEIGPGAFLSDWFRITDAPAIAKPPPQAVEPVIDAPSPPEPEPEPVPEPQPEVEPRISQNPFSVAKEMQPHRLAWKLWQRRKSTTAAPKHSKGTQTGPWADKPKAEDGVTLSIGLVFLGVIALGVGAALFDSADISFTLSSYDDAASGLIAGAVLTMFLGARRLVRKRQKLGWIAKVICILVCLAMVGIAFAALSTMRF